MFPLYKNQSVDLQSKSTDWFLYNENFGRERVNCEQKSLLLNICFITG